MLITKLKNKNKLTSVVLGDIHFGIKHTKKLFKELDEEFITYVTKNAEKIDMVILDGDYFHKKINLNEYSSKLALAFFDKLVNICEINKMKLRVIKGTLSHDNDQLDNFYHYYDYKNLDINIIKTVKIVEEYKDINILYIPEEYIEDPKEYYKEYRELKPNIIIGHGTWDFVAFNNQIIESESHDKAAPIFMYNEWKDYFDLAIFGHIHTRQKYKNKIWYGGSFTRWAHGEEKNKGFLTFEYDVETRKYKVKFIDNKQAPEYKSINLSMLNEDINNLEIEDIVNIANVALTESDTIRLELSGLTEDKLILIKKTLANNDKIKIKVKNNDNEIDEDKYIKYNYIIERELTLPETVSRFIFEEYGHDISKEIVENYLLSNE